MLDISKEVIELSNSCEIELENYYKKLDDICLFNSMKVLEAFDKNNISEIPLNVFMLIFLNVKML